MCIQQQQADSKGVELKVIFANIKKAPNEKFEQDYLQIDKEQFSPIMKSDVGRIQQVLLNLQSNALKFTTKGSIQILVEITRGIFDHDNELENEGLFL